MLIVDDNCAAIYVLAKILSHRGAVTITADSSKAALARLAQMRVTVIVSDVSMPGFSGHDFMRAVRGLPSAAGKNIPAIALTAFDEAGQRQAATAAGFDGYLVKPFDVDALVREIARLARRRGRRRESK
ncbi:MAG: response regulator [Tepidiformaceae bacterium]